ncbi:MAG: sodium-coupled transporter [Bacteroidales bacterium]|nr:sodium-coupled transporter [Bacteroidales bacterium]
MIATLIILLVSAILFVSGRIRSDLVAICALLALLLCQVLTPAEGLSGFSNTTVIMMIGLFVVGGGILQTGLAKMIGSKVMSLSGNSETKMFLLVMLVTGAIGAFVSNTGTVALMLPIIVSMAAGAGKSPRRFLMPLAFASSMGGMMTLIGTPPNLIVSDTLQNSGYTPLSFFSFLPVGLIVLAVGIVYLLPATKMLAPKEKQTKKKTGKSLKELVNEYGISSTLFRVHVKDASSGVIGKTVAGLNVYREYGINVLEVRRSSGQNRFVRTVNQQLASPDMVIGQGDVLYISGEPEMVSRFATDYSLRLLDIHTDEIEGSSNASMDFFDIGVAEILIMPTSSMIGRKISEAGFRNKFSVNVLGIRRKNDYILRDLGGVKILEGDVLLVQGAWSDIARMRNESVNWVVLGEPLKEAAKVTLDYKAPVAAVIMIAMIVMMVVDKIPVAPVTSVLLAAILMVITGCVRSMEAAYKTINWQTIVLFAAMLPMSIALEKTGVSTMISDSIVDGLGGSGPRLLLAGIYAVTSLMTIFISNTVTAVLMAPIALQCAVQIGVSPVPFMFAVTVAASMCFASPFSTPPNALVMSAGQYTFMDYVKVGLPLQILMGVVMVFVLPLLFPF